MTMQISEVMMPSPHNFPFILYTEITTTTKNKKKKKKKKKIIFQLLFFLKHGI